MEYNSCAKLYNDKLMICEYRKPPERKYKQISDTHKVNIETGELIKYQWSDIERRSKSDSVSLMRTRNRIVELSTKNSFDYFLTVTFNQKFVDRSNALEVHQKFKNILKRLKYKYQDIEYIAVPEFHKDGLNIHYHLMINFAVKPKMQFWKKSKKGAPLYYVKDSFKKEDCFLVISPLQNNNTHYLIKYLTKAYCFPLYRKFSCSRKLKRSRLITNYAIKNRYFNFAKNFGKYHNFITECRNMRCHVLVRNHILVRIADGDAGGAGGSAPPPDLSYINTKDENLEKIFEKLVEYIEVLDKKSFCDKQKEKEIDKIYKLQPEQLTFGI